MWQEFKDYCSSFVAKVGSDFKSLRGLWCWIYLAFYPLLVIWCVSHYPASINTAITVTGGLVGTIFSGYVISKSWERNAEVKAAASGAVKEQKDDSSGLP